MDRIWHEPFLSSMKNIMTWFLKLLSKYCLMWQYNCETLNETWLWFQRRHNIIVRCWRYLLGLQDTPLNWLHRFIVDSTSWYYNLSFTISSDPLMSRGGPLMSSPPDGWLLTDWLLVVTCNLSTIRDSSYS
jgi:hypothetical protein